MDNYVCYGCDANFQKFQGESHDVRCPHCASEFVEKLEDDQEQQQVQQSSQTMISEPIQPNPPSQSSALAQNLVGNLQNSSSMDQAKKVEVDSQGYEFESCNGSDDQTKPGEGGAVQNQMFEQQKPQPVSENKPDHEFSRVFQADKLEEEKQRDDQDMEDEDCWEDDDGEEEEEYYEQQVKYFYC